MKKTGYGDGDAGDEDQLEISREKRGSGETGRGEEGV